MNDLDVLIVGAGPTGLMLACQLARRGAKRLAIVDRHAGPARETRALGVQARTLEIYAQLGIVEQALALGRQGRGADLWAAGRHTARVPLGDAGTGLTPYPFILVLGQDDNEKLLGARLHELGHEVQWQTELTGLATQADGLTATLREASGATRSLRAAWVAGCDGAHSAVRRLNAIDFPGAPYEHVFFVADVEATGSMVPDEVNVYLWARGFHLFFPMRGEHHWRLVGIVPEGLRDRSDLRFEDVVPAVREQAGPTLALPRCSWFSTYRIHHRKAARFAQGRSFLLGDAAHIHSPVGAQGMNTGLQDAYNLAWKLALVVQGQADARLLDSYAAEREPIAERLLATTDRAFRLVVADDWWAGLLRTQVLARLAAFAMRRPAVQKLAFRTVSQTGLHYRASLLSQALEPLPGEDAPQAGDRFPILPGVDDLHFQLLAFGQPAGWQERLSGAVDASPRAGVAPLTGMNGFGAPLRIVDGIAPPPQVPSPSFYLLRPDGHVGLAGRSLDGGDAIARYGRERLALAAGAAASMR